MTGEGKAGSHHSAALIRFDLLWPERCKSLSAFAVAPPGFASSTLAARFLAGVTTSFPVSTSAVFAGFALALALGFHLPGQSCHPPRSPSRETASYASGSTRWGFLIM